MKLEEKYPALKDRLDALRRIFDAAGPERDLMKVPSNMLAGETPSEKVKALKALNADLEAKRDECLATEHAFHNGAVTPTSAMGTRSLRARERLEPKDSMADWVQANGHGPSGFDVPDAWDAFARGVLYSDWQRWQADFAPKALSTAEPGGGYLVPDELSAQVIDLMRSTTPIFQAGARVVPMTASTLDIARITGDPTAAWKAEAAAITASDVTLDRVRFTARTLPVLVKVTRELAEDAPNLGDVVKRAIGGAIGVEVTRVALRGSGTAPEPRGIRNQTGVTLTALGANGGPATHDVLIDEAKNVQLGNVTPNALIWHPRTSAALAKTKDTTNQYVPFPEALKDISRFPTTVLPTNIVKGTSTNATEIYTGAFSQLLIGMRTALRVELLRERFADSGEFAFLAWMRADVQLEHGAAFSVVTDVTN